MSETRSTTPDDPEQVDLNLTVLCGRLAVNGEVRTFDSGAQLIRYLTTVRVDHPRRRVDVIPVTLWDPPAELVDSPGQAGDRIWIAGSVQRRFWESPDGRRSRIEVVAEQVNLRPPADAQPGPYGFADNAKAMS